MRTRAGKLVVLVGLIAALLIPCRVALADPGDTWGTTPIPDLGKSTASQQLDEQKREADMAFQLEQQRIAQDQRVAKLQSQLASAQAALSAVKKQRSALSGQVASLTASVADLEQRTTQREQALSAAQGALTTARTDVASARADLASTTGKAYSYVVPAGVAGLLVGVLLALSWSFVGRRKAASPVASPSPESEEGA